MRADWILERLDLTKPLNHWRYFTPESIRKRSGRKAFVVGAENFHMLSPSSPRVGSRGGLSGSMFVPPPLPAEFQDGACFGAKIEDRERFFPSDSLVPTLHENESRDYLWDKYCADCPVKNKCFEWGMAYEEWGIWAGATAIDRQDARRDEELLTAARYRLAAGYIPFKSKTCTVEGCNVKIKPTTLKCRKHAAQRRKK